MGESPMADALRPGELWAGEYDGKQPPFVCYCDYHNMGEDCASHSDCGLLADCKGVHK